MNKIQKVSVVLAAVALTASSAFAMSENWSAQLSRFLTLQGGTTGIASGDLVEIGTVASPGTASAALTPAQLAATMNVWATTTVGTGTAGVNGSFAAVTASPGAGFFSQQIYMLAFNASTVGGATQMGMFTDTSWVFPASDGASANSLDLGDTGVTAVKGQLSSGTVTSPSDIAGGDAASLVLVPEPSTWMLVGTGLLGLLGLRRRS